MLQPSKDVVDLAERHSQAAAAFSLAGLDDARKRAHSLLLVLLGGAGAMGAVGLARLQSDYLLSVAALAVSACWFALAAYVAWRAMTTAEVRTWATPGLLEQFPKWDAWANESKAEAIARGEPAEGMDALQALRQSTIRNCELAAQEYRTASVRAHQVIDRALRFAAVSPVIGALAAAWACLAA